MSLSGHQSGRPIRKCSLRRKQDVKEAVRSKISIHKRVGEKFPDDLLLSPRYLSASPMVLIYPRRPRERIRDHARGYVTINIAEISGTGFQIVQSFCGGAGPARKDGSEMSADWCEH
ncbi:hypothetical protein F2P79_001637 [Pimephales promelas]|nr:hypothetical protein F2P79_001637 [Pimephales promelas]KAG1969733.1 hypothetical protein F2P79_001637 [Pimephales promelas]